VVNHPNRSKKAKSETAVEETVICVKGFDKNLRCRGFQYEIGKTYEHDGYVVICETGFHACENPLDVFKYYSPAQNRFALVEQSGKLAKNSDDTKVASAKITIQAEIHLGDLIQRAVKWVFDRSKPEEGASATGTYGAASATGWRGAASATGTYEAAMSCGRDGRAMGIDGCALFLVHRDDIWKITKVWAGIVGENGIKEKIWYKLSADGVPIECDD